jgi:predicted transposase YbfD/YdcC
MLVSDLPVSSVDVERWSVGELRKLPQVFAELPEPRRYRRPQHLLTEIVVMALFAVCSGADSWQDIRNYAWQKRAWLATFLNLPAGIPSRDTFRRVFSRLDCQAFQQCFVKWLTALHAAAPHPDAPGPDETHVAIDGKTLRRSFDKAAKVSPLHLVEAWSTDTSLVLGQVATEVKSNEITAIPELLKLLDLDHAVFTIDAAGCQKEIAAQIIAGGGDYILALKDNHPHLLDDVSHHFEARHEGRLRTTDRRLVTQEKNRGRQERREYYITPLPAELRGQEAWAGLQSVVQVITTITHQGRETNVGRETNEVRYYLSSLPPVRGARIAQCVRQHWGIENGLHWTLDMSFREDESRIRHRRAQENFAWLRRTALSLLKQYQTRLKSQGEKDPPSIRGLRKSAGWDNQLLANILLGTT